MNYAKNRKELIDEMKLNYGFLFCEHCNTSNAFMFHTHHIYYRSEKPSHKNLHHKDNLIILCDICHTDFHANKSKRKYLIKKRKLKKLFK